jgi:hypothetical protein
MSNSDQIIVRKAKLNDINELCDLYLGLSTPVRRFFHPFPFNKVITRIWFLAMIISGKMLTIIKQTYPRLGFILLVAHNISESQIVGFMFLQITSKECGNFVANIGLTTREGVKTKGIGSIGTKMYAQMIKCAKETGIGKFRHSILDDNVVTIMLTKRTGHKFKGFATDEWEGKYEKTQVWELEL